MTQDHTPDIEGHRPEGGDQTPAAFPPEGFVDRHQAARMLGVARRTLSTWESEGRIPCGRSVAVPGKPGTQKVYPLDAIQRLAEQVKLERVFPPSGWVTNHEAAAMLGVALDSLTCDAWKWREALRECGKCIRHPNGGRCNVYSVEGIQRIIADREASSRLVIPEGFVDVDGACRMFGVARGGWKTWIRVGKVSIKGTLVPSPVGGKQKLYAIADLERMKEELFGEDKLYKDGKTGVYHVPAGFVRREQAWGMFGVSKCVWERWEREGRITCGMQVPAGPKIYKVEDIKRMLMEFGRFAPPYPDPERPGALRVPLSGRGIRRNEAIVDADTVALIEGGTCSLSQTGKFRFVAFHSPEVKSVPLRRVILGVTDPKAHIGHANDDPLDCRRENLVVRTVSQRGAHMRKRANIAGRAPTSRFKGVYWETYTKKWRAAIKANGKSRRLGRFGDEVAAAVAYDEAARQWFGEHARLNFPDGVDAWIEQQRKAWEAPSPATEQREAA
jgi:hypothetical protein